MRAFLAAFVMTGLLTGVSHAQWLDIPRGKGEQCVEPTEIMRKQHMDFLLHDRDLTMRQGLRTIRHSLVECVACHVQADTSGKAIPINAPDQFCAVCHDAVGVKMDCFQCHATIPDDSAGHAGATDSSIPESVKALMNRWVAAP
ncbi:MAG: Hdr-like menaquinol oxidoreductase cytochrome c subunit [Gammaproteobacteria bacterium]|nr:Hdr-like menaquinol oxidoreductase cytochrome c subunit [Gammaproteobacteria bacterium]MYD76810.1 Hdr-like menaquinol oxidoreductase cytochrome c subunit [Gammaproteobacteria bacterium]MYJ51937.1 Hdr-like menaquinol oxidoreductase cytochrome c subunit [Gammaproteobacteria bacterium]